MPPGNPNIDAGFAIVLWLTCSFATVGIAKRTQASGCLWLVAGLVLGPLGPIAAFALAGMGARKCRFCLMTVAETATRCPHCMGDLVGVPAADAYVKRCSSCAEVILAAAKKCRFCGDLQRVCPVCGAGLTSGTQSCKECAALAAGRFSPPHVGKPSPPERQ